MNAYVGFLCKRTQVQRMLYLEGLRIEIMVSDSLVS